MKKVATVISLCILTSIISTTVMSTAATPWGDGLLYLQHAIAACCLLAAAARAAVASAPMRLTAADAAMAAWWLYAFVRTYACGGDVPACRQLTAYTTLSLTYAAIRLIPKPCSRRLSAIRTTTLLLLAATAYELLLGVWQICSGTSHHRLFPATGSMFNPGPYSAYIAIGMTLAIGILHDAHDADWHRPARATLLWLCGGIATVGCFVIAAVQSRSAMIAVAAATAWTYRRAIKPKYAICGIAAAAAAGAGLFALKAGSAMGRIVIWRQALAMVADAPLAGSGIGSFAGEYGRQLARFFAGGGNAMALSQYADVADYAFCDILQIAAEQGITGCLLCLTFVALSLRSLNRHSPRLATALATLLLFSLFSYPMQLLPLQTVAVCLAAIGQTYEQGFAAGRRSTVAAAALCATAAVCCRAITLPRIKAQAEYASIKGMTHYTFVADYYRLLPLCSDDKRFLFDFAHLLQANGRHLDACAILRRGIRISGDPMFWVLMGNSQREMRQYTQAAACYDRAFAILPNRLYPLYQKMMMYSGTGNDAQARRTARLLLGVKPKIESGATREMKAKAEKVAHSDRS